MQATKPGRRSLVPGGEDDITHSADVSGESDTTEDDLDGDTCDVSSAHSGASRLQNGTGQMSESGGYDGEGEGKVPGFFSLRCKFLFMLYVNLWQATTKSGLGHTQQRI